MNSLKRALESIERGPSAKKRKNDHQAGEDASDKHTLERAQQEQSRDASNAAESVDVGGEGESSQLTEEEELFSRIRPDGLTHHLCPYQGCGKRIKGR